MSWDYLKIVAENTARAEAEHERALAEGRSFVRTPINDDTPLFITDKGLQLLAKESNPPSTLKWKAK